jgi:hypothetical protein
MQENTTDGEEIHSLAAKIDRVYHDYMHAFEHEPSFFESETSSEFRSEEVLGREKTVLDKFRGRAKELAALMIFASSIACGPRVERADAGAHDRTNIEMQNTKPRPARPSTLQKEIPTSISARTSVSSTAEAGVGSENNDTPNNSEVSRLKTKEDAEWYVRSHLNPLISEFYIPTKGEVVEGPYGVPIRKYSAEEYGMQLKSARIMERTLTYLHKKFGLDNFEERMAQIRDMITKLEQQSSYAGQAQREILDAAERALNNK